MFLEVVRADMGVLSSGRWACVHLQAVLVDVSV